MLYGIMAAVSVVFVAGAISFLVLGLVVKLGPRTDTVVGMAIEFWEKVWGIDE